MLDQTVNAAKRETWQFQRPLRGILPCFSIPSVRGSFGNILFPRLWWRNPNCQISSFHRGVAAPVDLSRNVDIALKGALVSVPGRPSRTAGCTDTRPGCPGHRNDALPCCRSDAPAHRRVVTTGRHLPPTGPTIYDHNRDTGDCINIATVQVLWTLPNKSLTELAFPFACFGTEHLLHKRANPVVELGIPATGFSPFHGGIRYTGNQSLPHWCRDQDSFSPERIRTGIQLMFGNERPVPDLTELRLRWRHLRSFGTPFSRTLQFWLRFGVPKGFGRLLSRTLQLRLRWRSLRSFGMPFSRTLQFRLRWGVPKGFGRLLSQTIALWLSGCFPNSFGKLVSRTLPVWWRCSFLLSFGKLLSRKGRLWLSGNFPNSFGKLFSRTLQVRWRCGFLWSFGKLLSWHMPRMTAVKQQSVLPKQFIPKCTVIEPRSHRT